MIFLPSLLLIALMTVIFVIPLTTHRPFKSSLESSILIDYAFEMVNNETVKSYGWVHDFYLNFYKDTGLRTGTWNSTKFFDSFYVELKDTNVVSRLRL